MNAEHALHARLSAAAYKPAEAHRLAAADGYVVDRELSDRNRTTFYHPERKRAVIAFRGTDVRNIGDMIANGHIAAGREALSTRFKTSSTVARRAIRKYGKDNLSVTGHSLGGSQAMFVHRKHGIRSVSFNPGASWAHAREGATRSVMARLMPKARLKPTSTIVSTGRDPISAAALFGPEEKVLVKQKTSNVHSLDNFL